MILLFGALLSHGAAGGSFVTVTRLSAEIAVIIPVLVFLSNRLIEGPKLALLVLFAQSNGHLLLGAGNSNNLVMMFSHLIGGIATYILISKFEAIWETSLKFVEILIVPFRVFRFNKTANFNFIYVVEPSSFQSFLELDSLSRRGPPAPLFGFKS